MKKLKDKIYHFLIAKLPYRIMYKHVFIDSQHKMWLPRWGYSERQLKESEKAAKELNEKLNWD